MLAPERVQGIYEELAERYQRRGDASRRDIFLILAADMALSSGRAAEAERIRGRLLEFSPHNMLSPFGSFGEALQSRDVREYVADLHRQFPAERSEKLLAEMGGGTAGALDHPFGKDVYGLVPPQPASQREKVASQEPAATLDLPGPGWNSPSPPAAPVKQARRSPYESPDYGPRVPSETASREFLGIPIIVGLAGLVALFGLGLLGYVLARPFLRM